MRESEKSICPWDKPMIIQYINLLRQNDENKSSGNLRIGQRNNQPFRFNPSNTPYIQRRYCIKFHTHGQRQYRGSLQFLTQLCKMSRITAQRQNVTHPKPVTSGAQHTPKPAFQGTNKRQYTSSLV